MILRILEQFTHKLCIFLKSFFLMYCTVYVCSWTNILHTLQVNNSRIPTIKNAKFSRYYFYWNTNIWGYFQICISETLMRYQIPQRNINQSEIGIDDNNFVSGPVVSLLQKTYYLEHSFSAPWKYHRISSNKHPRRYC